MKVFLTAVGFLFISAGAYASEPQLPDVGGPDDFVESFVEELKDSHDSDDSDSDRGQRWQRVRKVCKKVNLTDDQKVELRNAWLDYKESTIQPRADMKAAKLKFMRLILDENAVRADANAAVSEGVTAKTSLSQAKGDLASKVMFDILDAEKRKPALRCLAAIKKARQCHERHGHDHGHDH